MAPPKPSITPLCHWRTQFARPTLTASMFSWTWSATATDSPDLAALVRPGGTAVTTVYVADADALKNPAGITGINFALQASSNLLDRLARCHRDRAHRGSTDHSDIARRPRRRF